MEVCMTTEMVILSPHPPRRPLTHLSVYDSRDELERFVTESKSGFISLNTDKTRPTRLEKVRSVSTRRTRLSPCLNPFPVLSMSSFPLSQLSTSCERIQFPQDVDLKEHIFVRTSSEIQNLSHTNEVMRNDCDTIFVMLSTPSRKRGISVDEIFCCSHHRPGPPSLSPTLLIVPGYFKN